MRTEGRSGWLGWDKDKGQHREQPGELGLLCILMPVLSRDIEKAPDMDIHLVVGGSSRRLREDGVREGEEETGAIRSWGGTNDGNQTTKVLLDFLLPLL